MHAAVILILPVFDCPYFSWRALLPLPTIRFLRVRNEARLQLVRGWVLLVARVLHFCAVPRCFAHALHQDVRPKWHFALPVLMVLRWQVLLVVFVQLWRGLKVEQNDVADVVKLVALHCFLQHGVRVRLVDLLLLGLWKVAPERLGQDIVQQGLLN